METPRSFFQAVRNGDISHIRGMLEAGVNVDVRDADGYTALMYAAVRGRIEIVDFLVGAPAGDVNAANGENVTSLMNAGAGGHTDVARYRGKVGGADVNATNRYKATALLIAAGSGHLDVVRYLVECGADVNAANYMQITALMRAATEEHLDIVRYLAREGGADINAMDHGRDTVLTRAAAEGHIAVVQCLVEDCGAGVDYVHRWGDTALMKAAAKRHLDIVRYLAVKCGADVNTIGSRGNTVLMEAAYKGRIDVVRCLAEECGASVDVANGSGITAVMQAARFGHLDVVRYLAVECRANVNVRDRYGNTALMEAAAWGHAEIVEYLVGANAGDVNSTNDGGVTVLMKAAAGGHTNVARYLAKVGGADVNATDQSGDTALLKAAFERHFDVVRYFAVICGADVNVVGSRGTTVLMEAASNGRIDIVRCLAEECGVSVDVVGDSGTTAVMLAAQSGHLAVIKYLAVERRLNVNATDKRGDTALMKAALRGHLPVVQFLVVECKADMDVTVLTKMIAKGKLGTVRLLAKVCGVDANATDIAVPTELMTAVQQGRIFIVRYLVVVCEANVNAADKYGDTPLTKAIANGHFDVVRALASEYGADVSTINSTGTAPLMLASRHGHVDIVRYLAVEHAVDVNASDISGTNALMIAAQYGHLSVVRYLAGDCGVDVNATNSTRTTALMIAARYGNTDVVRYLVTECRANVNAANAGGYTAIRFAADRGHEVIQQFLARFFIVQQPDVSETVTVRAVPSALVQAAVSGNNDGLRCIVENFTSDVNSTDRDGDTALLNAAGLGRLAIVRYLVAERGADVNSANSVGITALMRAAAEEHLNCVRYLAGEGGADVDIINCRGNSALMEAACEGRIDVVRCLAEECGARVDVANGSGITAVMLAAQSGHLDVVRYLAVECRANVNATDKSGDTALMYAALQGHFHVARFLAVDCEADLNVTVMTKAAGSFDVVRFLVEECKVDANATDISGATTLMSASQHGRILTVRYLVDECKADVNAADKYGDTPLTKAIANGHFDVVRALASEYGANVSTVSNTGTTPLMLAAQHGHVDIVRYLAGEYAVDVNAADISGTTALMIAAQYGHINVVRYLAGDCGADANATNSTRTTALMIAAQYGKTDVVQYLVTQCRANANAANADGYTAIRFAAERGHDVIQRFLTRFLLVHQADVSETVIARSVSSDAAMNKAPSWVIPPSEISLVSFVETGNIGGEYKAKWLDADAAVKLFVPDASSHVAFEHEVHFWHRLRHPNVIKMYGACDASPLPLQFFVCEYASSGSLLEHVELTPVWTFLHQAALGLEYLHERKIIHGDLRCSNILIGSDGLAKLANFSRSNSMHRIRNDATFSQVGSVRWQPPEVLKREASSFASDVYSLGMCILEAVTEEVPWKDIGTDYMVRGCKLSWTPENAGEGHKWAPKCSLIARDLVWRMCCQDPDKRASLSSVVHELERLALRETSRSFQPEHEPPATYDNCNYPARKEVWMDVQECIKSCENDLYRLAYTELEKIRKCLEESSHPSTMFDRFHALVRDFRMIITSSSERARVLQLSATRATNSSMTAFRRRLQSLRTALGESDGVAKEQEARWEQQRSKQIEIFVSEASKTYLLVEKLKSPEERVVFLASLKAEMENPLSKYTQSQLDLLKKAYDDIASRLKTNDQSSLTPDWFIPWFELIIDKYDQLGSGGFGSVFRAKWLDSEVVVKVLIKSEPGAAFGVSCTSSSYSSLVQPVATTANLRKREETMAVFRHEVDIWFGLSHPHVVRLFGACHVGRPFFVCEFATNGTLVSYLRKHPDELWAKLHEAALGVQYLHARNVVHGDLKGNNIVIGSDKKAKVTDFGLSAITNDGIDPRISGASHWVAPECFIHEFARPTFESDIYALGMCIVEALRVVAAGEENTKPCLPWGALDNFVAKCHATQGLLPPRPPLCTDDEWELVQRMCVFEPTKRLKISTVVDELAKMANLQNDSSTETSVTDSTDPAHVLEVITTTQKRLARRRGDQRDSRSAVLSLYVSLWDHLEQVYHQIDSTLNFAGLEAFCLLVAEADRTTKNLKATPNSLVALTETTQRCYALQRRLEKYAEAHFQS